MSETEHAKAQRLELGIPGPITLEGETVAVVAKSIRLDDQRVLAPEEVHFPPPNGNVDLRTRQMTPPAQLQEQALKLAASYVNFTRKVAVGDQLQVQCASCRALEEAGRHDPSKVFERPGRACHRNAVPTRELRWRESGRAMDSDAVALLPPAPACERDVDRSRHGWQHSPDCGGRAVTNNGNEGGATRFGSFSPRDTVAFTAAVRVAAAIHPGCGRRSTRQGRREASALECDARVPDGIHPAVKAMDPTRLGAAADPVLAQTDGQELTHRDHAVLASGDDRH